MPDRHAHITRINFSNGAFLQASTDQWIALLLDVLHPSQQEVIIQRLEEMSKAQQDKPLVEIPGFVSQKGVPIG